MAARLGPAVGGLSRRLGAGGGGVIGGRVTLALDPSALPRLAAGRRSALVSGTNGKTTTTRLLARALGTAGPVVTNAGGANLPYGLVAALSAAPPDADRAALEVDEAYLGRVADAVHPEAVVLLNLSRDQLDRINEVRMLAGRWRAATAALPLSTTVVANADDPMVVWGAQTAPRVVWVAAGTSWTLDASGCPACEGRIEFSPDGQAPWSCTCGFSRPSVDVSIDGSDMVTGDRRITLRLALPGRCNRANAAMAVTAAEVMGADPADAAASLATVADVDGRYGVVRVGGAQARLLLAKNPAGWAEIFDLLNPAPAPVVVAINARVADGRDPSWLWDVPFERLAGRHVVATGERCRDLAVRLRYAEVEHETVPDLASAVSRGAGHSPVGTVDVVANYTTFQALRRMAA
ncbi:MAG TPA: MurT ligase domain-containing protein [Acidimicrobiales bacterium]|nr:MurT ligase domain-containing protein [Acidimicrobiales bacterium]